MKIAILFLVCIFIGPVIANTKVDNQLKDNRKQLDRVQDQINSLRKEIAKTDIKASSTLEQIKILDKEIALLTRSTRLLTKKSHLLSNKIDVTRNQLQVNRRKLRILKDQYLNRVVHLYKYGKIQNIELLLNVGSINQALVRYKYLKFFNDQEKLVIQKIKSRVENIQILENQLSLEYQNQRQTLQTKERQYTKSLSRKNEKKVLVKRLKWNSQSLNKELKSAEEEYQKLFEIIVALERQRQLRERRGETNEVYTLNLKDIKKNKGRLPWPVKGEVLHKYGKQHDSRLKTTINNTGIDIKANAGTEVKAVFIGLVSTITYLSGFGNTVILDHGEGYYTVYSHLDEFFVEPDELVMAGHTIGLVGDSGSLEGNKLHFAVFANQKTENPQLWLR
jgi:septal ring factor EnvC (AmiA/AmiB activator)